MDQRTRKLMIMNKAFHPSDNIDGLYVSRKAGVRGLANIDDYVDASTQSLKEHIKMSKERLITAANNSNGNIRTNRNPPTKK